ncbi:Pirin domain protein [Pirellula staleyi DSM 6068]|uniref:Pirin domain protein n=1 Tax=Pirellula staleyi (strain ATCC 27377 / DSM 6068 / ICPB 4128) TaxID=530564 RepID=D2QY76_PIRSD|nr:pirin family protein [Pirellula staleyi]ADB16290.1 Pirin domain protein [Pirellula staleyi DSM 6068]
MVRIRKANERGGGKFGWLDTKHTFSFGEYFDPAHMGFHGLRVMNEDYIEPGMGFGMHGHRDMEIVTLMVAGELAHKDSLGNGETLRPGELQRMTAGSGIRHSEFNPSSSSKAHLYQIWLEPHTKGLTPSYEQKKFPTLEEPGKLHLVASPDGRDGSLKIHQHAEVYLAKLHEGDHVSHGVASGRAAWLQVIEGNVTAQAQGEISSEKSPVSLAAGDGLAIEDVTQLSVTSTADAFVLLFDLP